VCVCVFVCVYVCVRVRVCMYTHVPSENSSVGLLYLGDLAVCARVCVRMCVCVYTYHLETHRGVGCFLENWRELMLQELADRRSWWSAVDCACVLV